MSLSSKKFESVRHRRSRRALVSCAVVVLAAAGTGAGAVNSFAAALVRHSTHAVPHLNLTAYNFTLYNGTLPRPLFETSEAGAILCGTALVLGAAVATFTVDKLGRKTLLLWSCVGITCCLALLGVYCDPHVHIHSWYHHRLWPYKKTHNTKEKYLVTTTPQNLTAEYFNSDLVLRNLSDISVFRVSENVSDVTQWVNVTEYSEDKTMVTPTVLLSLVLFLYNIGLGSVPYVLMSEMFSINVRSLASSLLISWMWLCSFLLLRYYGLLALAVGLHGTYYISATITLLGALYIFLTIPETKGKSQEQIDLILDGPLLVVGRRLKNRR